jgi:hypothetical protein
MFSICSRLSTIRQFIAFEAHLEAPGGAALDHHRRDEMVET